MKPTISDILKKPYPDNELVSGKAVLAALLNEIRKDHPVYGSDEESPFCRELAPHVAKVIALGGGHHFGGNYEAIADAIIRDVE